MPPTIFWGHSFFQFCENYSIFVKCFATRVREALLKRTFLNSKTLCLSLVLPVEPVQARQLL